MEKIMNFEFISQKHYRDWLENEKPFKKSDSDPRWEEPEGFVKNLHDKAEKLFPDNGLHLPEGVSFDDYLKMSKELLEEKKPVFSPGFVDDEHRLFFF